MNNKNLYIELAICLQEKPKNVSIDKDADRGFKISPSIDEFNDAQGNIDNEKLKENLLYLFNKLKIKIIINLKDKRINNI